MAAEVSKDVLLDKLRVLKRDVDVIVLKQLSQGYIGITAKDFAGMLNWIYKGKVVIEAIKGYDENGNPIIERAERDPTLEEIKQRWKDSGYIEFFEECLSKRVVDASVLKALFGSEKPWL